MTVVEAGVIAGALSGAAVGAVLGGRHGTWGGVGAGAAGVFAGAAAGWLFAAVLIGLLSFIGVLWRAARKRSDDSLTETEIRTMTPVAVVGTFISALAGLVVVVAADWRAAIASVMASAIATAFVAVARCELRKAA